MEKGGTYFIWCHSLCRKKGKNFGTAKSLRYKVSPITSGGLEVPPSLAFSYKRETDTIEEFEENVYRFGYSGSLHSTDDINGSDDEEENHYQTITLETKDMEEEIGEPEEIDSETDKNSNIPI